MTNPSMGGVFLNRFWRKFLMNGIVVIPLLIWFTEATFLSSLIVTLVLCAISFIIGDQLILRMSNNWVATIADAGLTFIYFWIVADMMDWTLNLWELTLLVAAVGIMEMIFHRQLRGSDRKPFPAMRFQTEFADEIANGKNEEKDNV
jgi:hypothetical protein